MNLEENKFKIEQDYFEALIKYKNLNSKSNPKFEDSRIYYNYIVSKRNNFTFIDLAHELAYEKNQEDLLILNNTLSEWIIKSDKQSSKDKIQDLLFGVWRISSFVTFFETVVKQSVTKLHSLRNENNKMENEIKLLGYKINQKDNEINSLKQEIEFIKSSK